MSSQTRTTEPNQPSDPAGETVLVEVDEAFSRHVDTNDLAAAVRATLLAEQVDGEVTLVVTTDEEVAALNEQYRGTPGPTDVLSFGAGPNAFTPPGEPTYLGDIIISYPRCVEQAQQIGHPTSREICLLTIHGVLHLLGYDHATEEEQREMWALQDQALASILPGPSA